MDYQLLVQHEAVIEIQEVYEWYERKKWGLGDEFIEAVEHCYQRLSQNPQFYFKVDEVYRRIKVPGFPYKMIYEIENEKVYVVAVKHCSQDIDY